MLHIIIPKQGLREMFSPLWLWSIPQRVLKKIILCTKRLLYVKETEEGDSAEKLKKLLKKVK